MSTSAQRGPGKPTESSGVHPVDPALAEVKFLTVAEVASVMRVSKMTVYRMVHGGDLPAVRVGRSFRVPEKAVHDYLRSA
ncbi:MAG TPA: helix-turn-helix domain-containing protein, partial [Jatrophihabitantaceae bacterium]|nr:helix-turn-helix domain-containing protein [Jatrophihabitantaceae bacterium]